MASRQAVVNDSDINGRYPLQFRFWLNANNQDELALADEIEFLKSKRRFHPTVRDGIRLILDLRAGKTDVLFQLFPWVKNLVLAAAIPADTPISRAAPTKPAFKGDDIQLEVKQAVQSADNNASWNFMISSAATVYGSYDNLPDVVIDYGIRTGRIPSTARKQKAPTQGIKKLAAADQALAAPTFDDLDL